MSGTFKILKPKTLLLKKNEGKIADYLCKKCFSEISEKNKQKVCPVCKNFPPHYLKITDIDCKKEEKLVVIYKCELCGYKSLSKDPLCGACYTTKTFEKKYIIVVG